MNEWLVPDETVRAVSGRHSQWSPAVKKKKKKKRKNQEESPPSTDSETVRIRGALSDESSGPGDENEEDGSEVQKGSKDDLHSADRGEEAEDPDEIAAKEHPGAVTKKRRPRSTSRAGRTGGGDKPDRPSSRQGRSDKDWIAPGHQGPFATWHQKRNDSPVPLPPSGAPSAAAGSSSTDRVRKIKKKKKEKKKRATTDRDSAQGDNSTEQEVSVSTLETTTATVSVSLEKEQKEKEEAATPIRYTVEEKTYSRRKGLQADADSDGAIRDNVLDRGDEPEVSLSVSTTKVWSNAPPAENNPDLIRPSDQQHKNTNDPPRYIKDLSSRNKVTPVSLDGSFDSLRRVVPLRRQSSMISEDINGSAHDRGDRRSIRFRHDSETSSIPLHHDDIFRARGGHGGSARDAMSSTSRHDGSVNIDLTSGRSTHTNGAGDEDLEEEEGRPGALKKTDSAEILNLTLHQCARDGDVYNMKIVLRHLGSQVKKKINQFDEDDLTPLHYAARYNYLGVVKMLVDNGADVNKRGEDDVTPLHHAARYRREKKKKETVTEDESLDDSADEPGVNGVPLLQQFESELGTGQETIISYLISKGADVNDQDTYGQTPLHLSAMRGNEVACRDLLEIKGVDIEAQDKQGISPLHLAALYNQVTVAKMLIAAGADLRCIDNEQCTPLHHACAEGNVELVHAFFEAGAKTPEAWVMINNMVTDQDVEGSTCLHVAVDNGHYEVAKLCLEKRADVNRPRKHYMYPLHLAAMAGGIQIVRLLVASSARVDVVNDEQATALHKAASLNHIDVVKFLVEKGSRIDRRDKDNYTPLLLAATYGHVETVELLLLKGADFMAVDKYDRTVLYMAAEENKLQVLKKLLSYAEVKRMINVSGQYDATPLHIAAQNGSLDIVRTLLSHGASLDSKNEAEQTPVHLAAKFGRTNIVREIVRMDKSCLHDEDEDSNTALHLAAEYGHNRMADILLELGADVSARNYNQWTPLDLAASKGWTKTCSILLDNDAAVDSADKNKTTPLHLAGRFGHPRVVGLLLDWDADVSLENLEGMNCLDLAIENNHSNVAMKIINSDVWQQALRNSTVEPDTGRIDTPMRKLIRKMPDVAERCFDRCMSYGQEKNPERPAYEITFMYEFLDDAYMPWIHDEYRKRLRDDVSSMSDTSSVGDAFDDDDRLLPSARPYSQDSNYVKKNSPLHIMVNSQRDFLLEHPLVMSLLNHKWNTFGRFFYYLSLLVYCIFLSFLSGFVLETNPPQAFDPADRSMIEDNKCDNLSRGYSQGVFSKIGSYIIIALAVINLLKEVSQIYQAKLAYLGWINLVEWITYVSALLLVINFNQCQSDTGYRYEWQWSVGALSVFLAWINLVLYIQKFPQLGIYVVMFSDVLYTFAHFFVVFFLFIVAFALAFYVLLQQQVPFSSVPKALIKTSVMMIGEFDFDTIFNDSSQPPLYPTVSYIIFIAFLVLMSIILMNLLVGLAVDDIKAVLDKAALKRMAMQVELALDVERVIPDFLRRKGFAKTRTIRPNQRHGNLLSRFFLARAGLTTKALQEHLNYEPTEIEKVQETQEKLSGDVKKLDRSVLGLRESSQRLESMIRAVIRDRDIDWQDEDYQERDAVDQIEAGLSY